MFKTIVVGVIATVVAAVVIASGRAMWVATQDGTIITMLGGVPLSVFEDRAVVREDGWPTETRLIGYGNGTYINTATEARCPDGTYAGGIIVSYGGTCRRECDADGGIIRNIELVCKPF